jgi:uncharacterized protein
VTAYFFDTSGLLKRYVVEPGTNWVVSVTNPQSGHDIFIAQITPVEIVSGISCLKRENVISANDAQTAQKLIERHIRRQYKEIIFTNHIVQTAKQLLNTYPLRAYDAVQLASALEANTRLTRAGLQPLIFVSADKRLLSAATGEGLQSHDPT